MGPSKHEAATMIRQYDIMLPKEIDERLRRALATAIKKGFVPNATTERDFLLATIIINGLAAVEADLINKDRESRSVLLPTEIPHGVPAPRNLGRLPMDKAPFSVGPGGQRTYHH